MTAEADMLRPSKRFVLPYEPEYTAHRADRRMIRAGELHRAAQQRTMAPAFVPVDPEWPAHEALRRSKRDVALEPPHH